MRPPGGAEGRKGVEAARGQPANVEGAWNDADGTAWGTVFADPTDFVNVRGEHHRGDGAYIGRAHQGIFDTIYAGSALRYVVDVARELAPACWSPS